MPIDTEWITLLQFPDSDTCKRVAHLFLTADTLGLDTEVIKTAIQRKYGKPGASQSQPACSLCGNSTRLLLKHPTTGKLGCLPCVSANEPDAYREIVEFILEHPPAEQR